MRSDFAVFILTHGRADNVVTYRTLRSQGYTGRIVIVIDNTDKQGDRYREVFAGKPGVEVYCFDKSAVEDFDIADNRGGRKCVVFARNASWPIAESLGLRYFLQLDDDYSRFEWRYTADGQWLTVTRVGHTAKVQNLDRVFDLYVGFMEQTPARTIAMGQGGDFIGGHQSANAGRKLHRKAMNSFFCAVDRPLGFVGRINEDTTTYTWRATMGDLFFTFRS